MLLEKTGSLRRRLPDAVTIVQNIDEIWWKLMRRGRAGAEAVAVDAGRYCVLTAHPLLKYQAYRRRLDLWIEGEAAEDHTAVFHDMIEDLLFAICRDGAPPEVTVCPEYRDGIDALYPEVHCRSAYAAFSSFLRGRSAGYLAVLAGLERLRAGGASYIPALNAILCIAPGDAQRAHEATRFVLYAMRDEIGRARRRVRPASDRFCAFVIEEALCRFGSRLLSPAGEAGEADPLVAAIDGRGVCRRPAGRLALEETRRLAAHFKYHVRRERTGLLRTTARLARLYRLPIRRRLVVVDALGHTLGDALHRAFLDGRVTSQEIRALFEAPLEKPGEARTRYLDLVRRLKPDRGAWDRPRRANARRGPFV